MFKFAEFLEGSGLKAMLLILCPSSHGLDLLEDDGLIEGGEIPITIE